jgi:hypothetical protein
LTNLNHKQLEKCAKSLLEHTALKKRNEIYCDTLKNVYKAITTCADTMSEMQGRCLLCDKPYTLQKIKNHPCT